LGPYPKLGHYATVRYARFTVINFSAVSRETRVGRLLRLPLRLLPANMVVPVLQGPLRGKKWIVGSHIHGCWLGSYEYEMQMRLCRALKAGDTFYDIGANVGFYTLLAASRIEPGNVYAFEPDPANVKFLRRHLELNQVPNARVFDVAIADHNGETSFEQAPHRAMGRLSAQGSLVVRARTLDGLISEDALPPPTCIKMDIEGAELGALRAGAECFRRHSPKLFLAVHGADVHRGCVELLRTWGYEIEYIAKTVEERAELLATKTE
jgi:FkbM family methyltransferase